MNNNGTEPQDQLQELPARELREIAAALGITHRSTMVREELIARLASHPAIRVILNFPS